MDTHIHRLAQRWGLTNGKSVVKTEEDLKKIFPKDAWNKLHLQIIFYGREFCTARGCKGITCEICRTCYPKRVKPLITKNKKFFQISILNLIIVKVEKILHYFLYHVI